MTQPTLELVLYHYSQSSIIKSAFEPYCFYCDHLDQEYLPSPYTHVQEVIVRLRYTSLQFNVNERKFTKISIDV